MPRESISYVISSSKCSGGGRGGGQKGPCCVIDIDSLARP